MRLNLERVDDWVPLANCASLQRALGMEGVAIHEFLGGFNSGTIVELDDYERTALGIRMRPGTHDFALSIQLANKFAVHWTVLRDGLRFRIVLVSDCKVFHG